MTKQDALDLLSVLNLRIVQNLMVENGIIKGDTKTAQSDQRLAATNLLLQLTDEPFKELEVDLALMHLLHVPPGPFTEQLPEYLKQTL